VGRDPGLSGADGRGALLHHRPGPPGPLSAGYTESVVLYSAFVWAGRAFNSPP
jgi:hypothetical protein